MSNQLPIHGIYDEWEREETARRDQSDRLKELFKRAKDEGYNAKSLRQAFAEWYALEHFTGEKLKKRERDASDVDLYLANLAGVRTREIIEEIPPHDADGVILETRSTATNHGGTDEYEGVAKTPISSTVAAKPKGLSAAVIVNDDMVAGAGSSAGGGSVVSASVVELDAPHYEAAE